MHTDAARPWTVPELAAVSGLSRAVFARIFQLALGQAPMQYLTDWRMTLARDHLRAGELTLAQIAARTGYASPYAFAAAFVAITEFHLASGATRRGQTHEPRRRQHSGYMVLSKEQQHRLVASAETVLIAQLSQPTLLDAASAYWTTLLRARQRVKIDRRRYCWRPLDITQSASI